MSQGPAEEGLAEVSRLATLLADQVLDARVMERPIPDEQVRALRSAALLLDDHAQPLPPLLLQVLREVEVAGRGDTAGAEPDQAAQGLDYTGVVKNVARLLFRPARRP